MVRFWSFQHPRGRCSAARREAPSRQRAFQAQFGHLAHDLEGLTVRRATIAPTTRTGSGHLAPCSHSCKGGLGVLGRSRHGGRDFHLFEQAAHQRVGRARGHHPGRRRRSWPPARRPGSTAGARPERIRPRPAAAAAATRAPAPARCRLSCRTSWARRRDRSPSAPRPGPGNSMWATTRPSTESPGIPAARCGRPRKSCGASAPVQQRRVREAVVQALLQQGRARHPDEPRGQTFGRRRPRTPVLISR